jgi:hypothetical protein
MTRMTRKSKGKNRQRRARDRARREQRIAEARAVKRERIEEQMPAEAVFCDRESLAPSGSWSPPTFVERGYYLDQPFRCVDCGKDEVWTAAQQKWWYEVAKGQIFTVAKRCRLCRGRQRERKTEARRVHLEGLAKKRSRD